MTKRRNLADVVSPASLDTPVIPARLPTRAPDPETRDPAAADPAEHPRPPAGGPAPSDPGAGRPAARELATPRRGPVAREALKADVPADLALLQRLRRYRLDNGMDIRDQVAIAVDDWLTSQGY